MGPDLGFSLFASSTTLFGKKIAKNQLFQVGADGFFMVANFVSKAAMGYLQVQIHPNFRIALLSQDTHQHCSSDYHSQTNNHKTGMIT